VCTWEVWTSLILVWLKARNEKVLIQWCNLHTEILTTLLVGLKVSRWTDARPNGRSDRKVISYSYFFFRRENSWKVANFRWISNQSFIVYHWGMAFTFIFLYLYQALYCWTIYEIASKASSTVLKNHDSTEKDNDFGTSDFETRQFALYCECQQFHVVSYSCLIDCSRRFNFMRRLHSLIKLFCRFYLKH
jgi:hypothetical protein